MFVLSSYGCEARGSLHLALHQTLPVVCGITRERPAKAFGRVEQLGQLCTHSPSLGTLPGSSERRAGHAPEPW